MRRQELNGVRPHAPFTLLGANSFHDIERVRRLVEQHQCNCSGGPADKRRRTGEPTAGVAIYSQRGPNRATPDIGDKEIAEPAIEAVALIGPDGGRGSILVQGWPGRHE